MPRKRKLPNSVRREVCRRYGAEPGTRVAVKCHYCWLATCAYWPMVTLEFDHYLPEFEGGLSIAENLVLACRRCNRSKATSTPDIPLVVVP